MREIYEVIIALESAAAELLAERPSKEWSTCAPYSAVRFGRLNAAAIAAVNDAVIRQRLTDMGQEIPPPERQSPDALAAFQRAEIEKWWPIIRAANIKAE